MPICTNYFVRFSVSEITKFGLHQSKYFYNINLESAGSVSASADGADKGLGDAVGEAVEASQTNSVRVEVGGKVRVGIIVVRDGRLVVLAFESTPRDNLIQLKMTASTSHK